MEEQNAKYLEHLNALNAVIQQWSEESDQAIEQLDVLLLEFDLAANQIREHANSAKDEEIETLCAQFQTYLVLFQEMTASPTQAELLCAWPMYMAEFISNREDPEAKAGLDEFLNDDEWPTPGNPNDTGVTTEQMDTLIDEIALSTSASLPAISDDDAKSNQHENLTEEQREFLDLINAEILEIQETHNERLTNVVETHSTDVAHLMDEIEIQIDQLDRIGSATEMVGLKGLKYFCKKLQDNLEYIKENNPKNLALLHEQFLIWPDLIQAYLISPKDGDYIQAILEYLFLDSWPIELNDVEKKKIENAFNDSAIEVDSDQKFERLREATTENISLEVPNDVPDELFNSLLQDLPQQTEEFSLAVQNLRQADFINQLEVSKRIAHTLKGAGNTVGIIGLANLTHNLEDILEALLKAQSKPNKGLHAVIENAAECLEEMSEFLHGIGSAPAEAISVFQEVLNWANRIDEEGIPTEKDDLEEAQEIVETPDEETASKEVVASQDTNETVAPEHSLRVPTNLIDDLLKRAGENIISNAQIQEFISRSMDTTKQLRSNNNKIKNLVQELEHLIEIRGFSSLFNSQNKASKFDPLEMDQFNELNTYANLLIEASADANEFLMNIEDTLLKLNNLSASQGNILVENQEAVLRTRMVPVKSIAQRLKRSVKQACKLSGKSAQLVIEGEDTLIDSEILNQLVNPLMHLLRNAIDHGIEASEEREQQGKSAVGSVILSFQKEGKLIHVTCKDDGHGLDIDRIQAKSIDKKLIEENTDFRKDDAIKIILQHGFSTKDEVSQLSGRGVGLDVVFQEIRDMKGSISMDSEYGQGVKVALTIPTTFHSIQALLISCADTTFAVSNRGIEEILHPGAGSMIKDDDTAYFAYKQDKYPIFDFQSLLVGEQDYTAEDPSQAVLIIQDEFNKKHAIYIDKILDSREVVVKPFSRFIPKMSGLLGTTILGDGSVTSVLDMLDIISIPDPKVAIRQKQQPTADLHRQSVLIVEDAISTRKSLAQFMGDLGFNVETSIDGVDAIDKIQKHIPTIVITDLEMPRMNGLELTDHLRSNEITKEVPIIMITSRATDKHKKEAMRIGVNEYIIKPYDEDLLLEVVNKLVVVN